MFYIFFTFFLVIFLIHQTYTKLNKEKTSNLKRVTISFSSKKKLYHLFLFYRKIPIIVFKSYNLNLGGFYLLSTIIGATENKPFLFNVLKNLTNGSSLILNKNEPSNFSYLNYTIRRPFMFNKNVGDVIIKFLSFNEKISIKLHFNFKKNLITLWPVRFVPTETTKLDVCSNHNKIEFLRKTKIFNKSRYSRNRQLYRTGVYWCLWVSIFLGWALYFSFYRVTINFSFLWWLNYAALSSFLYSKFIKYNLYDFFFFLNFFKLIFLNFFLFFSSCFKKFIVLRKFNFFYILHDNLKNTFWKLL